MAPPSHVQVSLAGVDYHRKAGDGIDSGKAKGEDTPEQNPGIVVEAWSVSEGPPTSTFASGLRRLCACADPMQPSTKPLVVTSTNPHTLTVKLRAERAKDGSAAGPKKRSVKATALAEFSVVDFISDVRRVRCMLPVGCSRSASA